jgi:excisionase family DNA binding protein
MARKKADRQLEPKMLRVHVAARELGLHPLTVRRWIKQGKLQAVRVGLEARIPRSELERFLGKTDERLLILYARVSGHGQQADLERQKERLVAWANENRPGRRLLLLFDIGSGISTTRKQLQRLLRLVIKDEVAEIAITSPDRLTRFGQDYLDVLFESCGVTLTILEAEETKTPEADLVRDMLSLLASFSGRLYGMRSHKQKELLKCAREVLTSP